MTNTNITPQQEQVLNVTNSAKGRKWVFRNSDPAATKSLQDLGHSRTLSQILAGRGISSDEAANFLSPSLRHSLPDPSSLQDMDLAATVIMDAFLGGKNITVFADYDVDGGTSAAQLIRWSRHMAKQNVDAQEFGLYVPDRVKEGYGPNEAAFRALKDEGVDLVITVDCGATAMGALTTAKAIGLDVVVIDHHMMVSPDLPPALAIVNPNRPDDKSNMGHLAAAGVSFLLLVALNREARNRGITDLPDLKSLLDLTALGTICDVVPLRGLNRAFVAQGLKVMSATPNAGLSIMAETASIAPPFTTYHGGFVFGPRINAGGRIGQANMGAQLLCYNDEEMLSKHAASLEQINSDRKTLQARILREAREQCESLSDDDSILIVAMTDWHVGVVGIVAGRLKDVFNKPVIVIGIDTDAEQAAGGYDLPPNVGLGKGSGRSMTGVDLGAAVHAAKEAGLILAGGGHAMAAGLSIDAREIDNFRQFMNEHLASQVSKAREDASQKIDVLINGSAVGTAIMDEIEQVAPYGADMPEPVFAIADLHISYAKRLKGGHVRVTFETGDGVRLSGIAFGADDNGMAEILLAPNPRPVHIATRLKTNSWKGRTSIDLQLVDIAIA